VNFGRFKLLSCQFGTICLAFRSISINLGVKYDLFLWSFNCDCSTSLPLQDGQSCFLDCWTSQFSYLWLCWVVWLCDVSFCQRVFPQWAGPMFWWVVENLMANNTYDSRAACLLNFAVYIESPWMRLSRITPTNRPLRVYILWSSTSIKDYW